MAVLTEKSVISSAGGITVDTSYLQTRNCTVQSTRSVKYVVIHYTGNTSDTAAANARYFSANDLSSSAHYFADENRIYQSVALCNRAWHCGTSGTYYHGECRNANSVGIEMCTSGNYIVSGATIENAARLAAEVCGLLGITAEDVDTYVLRHYDVTHKSCPAQWTDGGEAGFASFKERLKGLLKGDDELMSAEYDELNNVSEPLIAGTDTVYRITADGP